MSDRLSKYETLSAAVASGDMKEVLKAQADNLAEAIDNCESGRDIAALHNKLHAVTTRLMELDPPKKETAAEKNKREAAERRKKAKPDG